MRLPARQRSDLAAQLIQSLTPDDIGAAEWEQAWTEELHQRLVNDDGQRFDLGKTVAELRASLGHGG